MDVNDVGARAVSAVIAGLIAGVVTALIVFVISALIPGVRIDAGFWGLIIGILVGLATFFRGTSRT